MATAMKLFYTNLVSDDAKENCAKHDAHPHYALRSNGHGSGGADEIPITSRARVNNWDRI